MPTNWCSQCHGAGKIRDPLVPWWKFWRYIGCYSCGGDGIAKPPGWPNHMTSARVSPPPPPRAGECKTGKCKVPSPYTREAIERVLLDVMIPQMIGMPIVDEQGKQIGIVSEIMAVHSLPKKILQFTMTPSGVVPNTTVDDKQQTFPEFYGESQTVDTLGADKAVD